MISWHNFYFLFYLQEWIIKSSFFYSSNYSVDELTKIKIASNKNIYYSQDKANRLI